MNLEKIFEIEECKLYLSWDSKHSLVLARLENTNGKQSDNYVLSLKQNLKEFIVSNSDNISYLIEKILDSRLRQECNKAYSFIYISLSSFYKQISLA